MTKQRIFIVHPSDWLTDHLPIGDGLVAHGFLQELASHGHEIHIATRMSELKKPYPSNVIIHRIPQWMKLRPLDRLEYMWRVRGLFRKLNSISPFDVAHQMNPVFTGLSLALIGFETPLVLGTYVPDWPDDPDAITSRKGFLGWGARQLKRAILLAQQSRAAAVLLTSPAARSRIVSKSALGRVHYVGHGVDVSYFSPAVPQSRSSNSPPRLLFLSNLGEKKGIFVLLDAFTEVLSVLPDCKLTIAGGGKELPEIEAIVEKNGWNEQVHIAGRVSRDQSIALYRTHDVYTLPSFGEPYATTILEAMSCGLPIVSTNANGVPYMVGPENPLVPIRDSQALATAILSLLQDLPHAAVIGNQNREAVLEKNSWSAIIDSLEAVYQAVAFGKGSSSQQSTKDRSLPISSATSLKVSQEEP